MVAGCFRISISSTDDGYYRAREGAEVVIRTQLRLGLFVSSPSVGNLVEARYYLHYVLLSWFLVSTGNLF
jgi:hypothetical protein